MPYALRHLCTTAATFAHRLSGGVPSWNVVRPMNATLKQRQGCALIVKQLGRRTAHQALLAETI